MHNTPTPYAPYSFHVSLDLPVPVADPRSLGLPPDAALMSRIRLSTARGAEDTPLARVFAPRSGQPGVRTAPSPFWILDGTSDGQWCSVRPVAPDTHEVYAADGTLLAGVTRRPGRVLPWPRRVRWSARLTATPQPVTGKEGTWYSWFLYVATSPIWLVLLLVMKVYDFLNGESDEYGFRPSRTRWRVQDSGTALDRRGIGEKTYDVDPRRLDIRVAYALAVLRTWEDRDRAVGRPSDKRDKAHPGGAEQRMTKEEAVSVAARYLMTKCYPDRPHSVVMLPDTAIEFAYGWTVRFDFREHIETGDFTKAPFTSVVVVPRDGTPAHLAPTFPPTETYMMLRAKGSWPSA